MNVCEDHVSPLPRPLKGRKRFMADLSELSAHPESIAHLGAWSVKSVKPGDEEASLQIVLANADGKTQTIILVASDSSLYPNEHTWFGYSEDAGALELDIARVIDKLSMKASRPLREVVEFFVAAASRGVDDEGDDENEMDDDDVDVVTLDDDYELPQHGQTPQSLRRHLQTDFVQVRAAGYHPGMIRTGNNRFILSVSLPTPGLFQHIPAHALLAWDRHFVEPGLYLTLLISGFSDVYPVLRSDGTLTPEFMDTSIPLKFKVGFTRQYKPSLCNAAAAFREFSLCKTGTNVTEEDASLDMERVDMAQDPDPGAFRRTSLSTSLESLLDQQLLRLVQLRRRFSLGWARAEELLWQTDMAQDDVATVLKRKKKALRQAERDEQKQSTSNNLPGDPLGAGSSEMNLLKIAFVFLLRRLALSTKHCVVCHKKLLRKEVLRPYVCFSGLCVFQYYSLNLGPFIENEIITNTGAVDLLVSLAYVAAAEGVLDEPLPRGMGLRVPLPVDAQVPVEDDGLCNFDTLPLNGMRTAIAHLLQSLPRIQDMKEYLQRQFAAGNLKVQLRDVDRDVLPAAWSVLRWCVASCTAHIQELTKPEDRLKNLDEYRQFRFLVGAPDKENKFQEALPARKHPTIFGFHGSPVRNWHSIIRHGLWFKHVFHGRSYGNGVYFSRDASESLGNYAHPSGTVWKNSAIRPFKCCTLAEIVHRNELVTQAHYIIANNTEWIMCRYLLVRTAPKSEPDDMDYLPPSSEPKVGSYLVQDPKFGIRIGQRPVDVPQPSYHLDGLVRNCVRGRREVAFEPEDRAIFDEPKETSPEANTSSSAHRRMVRWVPDSKWVQRNAMALLPPPTASLHTASAALQRELRAMMQEQNTMIEKDELATLGWHLPPQHNEDNLYQWLVELHSFDPELPIAQDMKSRGVSSVVMEIRFPASYPHAPPFFRVIRPRFRPFMEGGGGHVTVGGSICMDLLTSDGWLPSYSISAVLLQIKLAMSSMTPYPARLQKDWDIVYSPDEALNGYIRAANAHDWKIKNMAEIRRLVTAV